MERNEEFRFYMHDGPRAFSFEVAGALTAAAARELDQAWATASSAAVDQSLIVDLSYVTRVEEPARRLLRRWYEEGAQLVAKRPQSRDIVASITGQNFNLVTDAALHQTWRPLYALWAVGLILMATPVPAFAL